MPARLLVLGVRVVAQTELSSRLCTFRRIVRVSVVALLSTKSPPPTLFACFTTLTSRTVQEVLAGSVHTQALKTTRRVVLLTQIHHIVSTISAYNVRPMQIVHRRIHVTKPVGNVSAQAEIAPKSVTRATAPTRTRFVRPLTHPSLTATTNSAVSVRLLH